MSTRVQRLMAAVLIVVSGGVTLGQSHRGRHGERRPSSEATVFPIDIPPGQFPHGAIRFSDDGSSIVYSAADRDEFFEVPYESRLVGYSATPPVVPSYQFEGGAGSPFPTADGTRVYFNSERLVAGSADQYERGIWYVNRIEAGWGDAIPIEVTIRPDWYVGGPHVTAGGDLYFSARIVTGANPKIYVSRFADGVHAAPERVVGVVNQARSLTDVFISPDESFMLFSSDKALPRTGPMDLFLSIRQPDLSWGAAINLGDKVNTTELDRFPSLSPDGKYLFFVRGEAPQFGGGWIDWYWIDASFLYDLMA